MHICSVSHFLAGGDDDDNKDDDDDDKDDDDDDDNDDGGDDDDGNDNGYCTLPLSGLPGLGPRGFFYNWSTAPTAFNQPHGHHHHSSDDQYDGNYIMLVYCVSVCVRKKLTS